MHSAIYNGWLRHRRYHPRKHEFQYDVFMMYIDLQELDQVLSLSPFWSAKKWRPARFCRTDFFGDPNLNIDTAIRQKIEDTTGCYPDGRICMLANFRYFGINMNPITSYYVFDSNDKLQHIVAEVHNTPGMKNNVMFLTVIQKIKSSVFNLTNKCMYRHLTRWT